MDILIDTNGGSVKLSKATLALILAITGPTVAAGIAMYRIDQLETQRIDQEARLREVQSAVVRFEATTRAVERQTVAIEAMRTEIAELSTQMEESYRR